MFSEKLPKLEVHCYNGESQNFAVPHSGHIFKRFVSDLTYHIPIQDLGKLNRTFFNFSEAYYAVDLTIQQFFRQSTSIEEIKLYFSHLRKESFVWSQSSAGSSPECQVLSVVNHHTASISGFWTFQRSIEFRFQQARELETRKWTWDVAVYNGRYDFRWPVLFN